jgi:hypothetical protein
MKALMTLPFLLIAPQVLAAGPLAEVICAPTADMVQRLTRQFGATQQALGLRGPEEVLEVWTDKRGEWTMVMTYASGQSCIVAMGEAWTELSVPHDPA